MRSTTNWSAICPKPLSSAPTRFAAGTRASTNDSSAVSEQCHPILRSDRSTVKPGVPFSTTSSEMPPWPAPSYGTGPVRTAVVTKSARTPEVMKVLAPLTT